MKYISVGFLAVLISFLPQRALAQNSSLKQLEMLLNDPAYSANRCLQAVGPLLSHGEMVAWSEELYRLHRKSLNALEMAKEASARHEREEAALFARRAIDLFNSRMYRQRELAALARERAEKIKKKERRKVWDSFFEGYPTTT